MLAKKPRSKLAKILKLRQPKTDKSSRTQSQGIALLILKQLLLLFVWRRNKRKIISKPQNALLEARVLRVVDGDTVEIEYLENKEIIRLYAIDCPEDGQHWAEPAKWGLVKLIGGRNIYLETYGFDMYGRTLATIYVMRRHELVNVNERMVVCGHAWVMRQYYEFLSRGRQRQLDSLESWARARHVGLWRNEKAIPPWQWRKLGAILIIAATNWSL